MVEKEVCVKWVKDKCVEWQTREDGGLTLNLNKCSTKQVKEIKQQLSKGLKVEQDLTEDNIK